HARPADHTRHLPLQLRHAGGSLSAQSQTRHPPHRRAGSESRRLGPQRLRRGGLGVGFAASCSRSARQHSADWRSLQELSRGQVAEIGYDQRHIPRKGDALMLRRIILARIGSAEKNWGVSLEYCKFILRVSFRAFFKFGKFLAVDEYRRVLPPG